MSVDPVSRNAHLQGEKGDRPRPSNRALLRPISRTWEDEYREQMAMLRSHAVDDAVQLRESTRPRKRRRIIDE